jgi:DNA replicative helicase MCM subunit Mcm2 (Cdc46/Mcm family)
MGLSLEITDCELRWLEKCAVNGWFSEREFIRQRNALQCPLAFEGIVQAVHLPKPMVEVAAYQCKKCEAYTTVAQDSQFLKAPLNCVHCGVEGPFRFSEEYTTYINSQTLILLEYFVLPQVLPRHLQVQLTGDQVGLVERGDHVLVAGDVKVYVCNSREYGKQETFTACLEAHNLEVLKKSRLEVYK